MRLRPSSAALGAETTEIDLSSELSTDIVAEIRAALLEHQVVFFRDQELEPDRLVAFAGRFGPLSRYPFVDGLEDQPEVVEIVKKEGETVWRQPRST